jgi:hypothetical protein
MKHYTASYVNGKDECWDVILGAENWKAARKEARRHQKEYGKLRSVRVRKTKTE